MSETLMRDDDRGRWLLRREDGMDVLFAHQAEIADAGLATIYWPGQVSPEDIISFFFLAKPRLISTLGALIFTPKGKFRIDLADQDVLMGRIPSNANFLRLESSAEFDGTLEPIFIVWSRLHVKTRIGVFLAPSYASEIRRPLHEFIMATHTGSGASSGWIEAGLSSLIDRLVAVNEPA
jgi:hypothetical protein